MITESSYQPAWWLPGPHAQTIWPGLFKRKYNLSLDWERLELPDNDFIDLVWTPVTGGPIVTVLHGLEGSINSHYAKGIMAALYKKGWTAVLMHFRGCSGTHNRLAKGYHSGETSDLRFVIKLIKSRYPQQQLAVTGFSLGGNVLLKYLGEYHKDTNIVAAIAVSVPFDLSAAADRLMRGYSRIYQYYLLKQIRKRISDKYRNRNDAPFSINELNKWNNFHLFDHHVTAPLHGFSSGKEYYALSSSRQFLGSIKIPTLIIHALNDPFLTKEAIPAVSELSENVTLELCREGGHAGFIAGKIPWQPHYWLEERIPEFLSNYLNNNKVS